MATGYCGRTDAVKKIRPIGCDGILCWTCIREDVTRTQTGELRAGLASASAASLQRASLVRSRAGKALSYPPLGSRS
jgi:hypothetical protein